MLPMILVIIGALIMGIYDDGNIGAAVSLMVYFVPALIMQKKARGK